MIEDRKLEHIKICLDKNVNAKHNYWDDVILKHTTIPKTDLEDIDLRVEFLGYKLDMPIIIDAMTGGHSVAKKINENIAKAAEYFGIGMAVGSQRSALMNPHLKETYSIVKKYNVPLRLGNLGAPQFSLGYGENEISRAMEMIDAHALEIHFNYLQESIQPEGDMKVKEVIKNLEKMTKKFPLIAKETGAGFDIESAKTVKALGFLAIDVSGMSGTSFAAVEYYRGGHLGKLFWDWGLPSPYCLITLGELGIPLVGSGGIRTGMDVAKALALGAAIAGISREILHYATKSYMDVINRLKSIENELRTVMFLTGASNLKDMKKAGYIIKGELSPWLGMTQPR